MRLTILGASGHGRVIADIAVLNGYDEIEFLDDDPAIHSCGIYPVVGRCSEAEAKDNDVFIAIGNADYREKFIELLNDKSIPVLVHPNAVVAKAAALDRGTVVMAGAVINPWARIGKGCIINTCSSVDHDCVIGDYVHVSVGAHISGTVAIGEKTWIGAGTTISNNVNICPGCMIGAGTVVVKDINEPGTYVGVPAKRLEKRK